MMDFYATIAEKSEAFLSFHCAAEMILYPMGHTESTELVTNAEDLVRDKNVIKSSINNTHRLNISARNCICRGRRLGSGKWKTISVRKCGHCSLCSKRFIPWSCLWSFWDAARLHLWVPSWSGHTFEIHSTTRRNCSELRGDSGLSDGSHPKSKRAELLPTEGLSFFSLVT